MISFRMIKDLLFVSNIRGGGCVIVISFQEDTAKMRSLPTRGCHYFLSIIYVWNQNKWKNKHHDVFYLCPEAIHFPFEFLYSLALQRAETCKGGNSGGRERTPSPAQPTRTDSMGWPLYFAATWVVWPNSAGYLVQCSTVQRHDKHLRSFGKHILCFPAHVIILY